jgi:hypothetical protein
MIAFFIHPFLATKRNHENIGNCRNPKRKPHGKITAKLLENKITTKNLLTPKALNKKKIISISALKKLDSQKR